MLSNYWIKSAKELTVKCTKLKIYQKVSNGVIEMMICGWLVVTLDAFAHLSIPSIFWFNETTTYRPVSQSEKKFLRVCPREGLSIKRRLYQSYENP